MFEDEAKLIRLHHEAQDRLREQFLRENPDYDPYWGLRLTDEYYEWIRKTFYSDEK